MVYGPPALGVESFSSQSPFSFDCVEASLPQLPFTVIISFGLDFPHKAVSYICCKTKLSEKIEAKINSLSFLSILHETNNKKDSIDM